MPGRVVTRRHSYDIDGLVAIASAVRLPELEFFRVGAVAKPDLVIQTRQVGGVRPRTRASVTCKSARIEYREHLGALFANFAVDMDDPITISTGPLLSLSPHVLYTNVVEPLLRFILASKGRMLLHAACVSVAGRPIMLSAKTDTGKTSTILTLLRQDGGTFFSDDMVIIDAFGVASRYPKPLTISAHTLRSVPKNRLTRTQRLSLSWQSRLHSKGGRSAGKRLGAANLPIMSMNAIVQALIPPPKYNVTQLVSCRIGAEIKMQNLYVIERGSPTLIEPIGKLDAVRELLENTDDAYGFPPYSSMAPFFTIGGQGHEELRSRERDILTSALAAVDVQRIRVADFSWPALINAGHVRTEVPEAQADVPAVPIPSGEWAGAATGAS